MILDSYADDFSGTCVFIIFLKFCSRCAGGNEIDTSHISVPFHIISCSCLQWQSDVGSGSTLRRPGFKCCFPLTSCVTLGKLLMSQFLQVQSRDSVYLWLVVVWARDSAEHLRHSRRAVSGSYCFSDDWSAAWSKCWISWTVVWN